MLELSTKPCDTKLKNDWLTLFNKQQLYFAKWIIFKKRVFEDKEKRLMSRCCTKSLFCKIYIYFFNFEAVWCYISLFCYYTEKSDCYGTWYLQFHWLYCHFYHHFVCFILFHKAQLTMEWNRPKLYFHSTMFNMVDSIFQHSSSHDTLWLVEQQSQHLLLN